VALAFGISLSLLQDMYYRIHPRLHFVTERERERFIVYSYP
jgi:hypothetical protein